MQRDMHLCLLQYNYENYSIKQHICQYKIEI